MTAPSRAALVHNLLAQPSRRLITDTCDQHVISCSSHLTLHGQHHVEHLSSMEHFDRTAGTVNDPG